MRLVTLLARHPPDRPPETHALRALMLLHAARFPGRVSGGVLRLLEDQDRAAWDTVLLAEGHARARPRGQRRGREPLPPRGRDRRRRTPPRPTGRRPIGPASWSCYDALVARWPSPVAALNRVIALAKVHGRRGRAARGRTARRRPAPGQVSPAAGGAGGPQRTGRGSGPGRRPARPGPGTARCRSPSAGCSRPGGRRRRARPSRLRRAAIIDAPRSASGISSSIPPRIRRPRNPGTSKSSSASSRGARPRPRCCTAPDRESLILMAESALPDEPAMLVPVAYKVVHEIRGTESEPKLRDLVERLGGCVDFTGRKVLYSWIGGDPPRLARPGPLPRPHRAVGGLGRCARVSGSGGQDQEPLLRHARRARPAEFDVIELEPAGGESAESKVYLSKQLRPNLVSAHRSRRTVVQAGD